MGSPPVPWLARNPYCPGARRDPPTSASWSLRLYHHTSLDFFFPVLCFPSLRWGSNVAQVDLELAAEPRTTLNFCSSSLPVLGSLLYIAVQACVSL